MKTLQTILQDTQGYFERHGIESARVNAEWLLAHALGLKRLDLYLQFERPLAEEELSAIRPLLKRRASGEPLQYILGSAGFINKELLVGPGVLIPRPETERLVEIAAELPIPDGPILDLCTGSGAILFGLADLMKAPLRQMTGVELSPEALYWANANLEKYPTPEITFSQGDLFGPVVDQQFALITSNPPYVTDGEYEVLPNDVRTNEPQLALTAGGDGLDVLRRILAEAPNRLLPSGHIICEIGERQGDAVQELAVAAGLREAVILPDYTKRPRFLHAIK